MLVDVEFQKPDPAMGMILALIGGGRSTIPERIETGMYSCGHWSIDQLVPNLPHEWEEPKLPIEPTSGVCDSIEQFKEKIDCNAFKDPVFVSFVQICRAAQSFEGGWRWHKWGPYIGEQKPQCEYLHDEPNIEEVYTFSIYRAPKPIENNSAV